MSDKSFSPILRARARYNICHMTAPSRVVTPSLRQVAVGVAAVAHSLRIGERHAAIGKMNFLTLH